MVGTDVQPPKRIQLRKEELELLSKEELIEKWLQQDTYLDHLESSAGKNSAENLELVSLRESEEKLKQQQLEASRRENVLVMRLTTKEQEMQEYAHQIQELKGITGPGGSGSTQQLRAALLDPAVNLLFDRMKREVEATRARLQETQNELSAWKFTPDSNTGKRLMAKCRLLYQENEELGKMISSGRMAKLEGDLALQRSFSEEMKKSQTEQDEFLLELDEEVEGMQSTIYFLQQQVREAKEQVAKLQAAAAASEKRPLANGESVKTSPNPPSESPAATNDKEDSIQNGHVGDEEVDDQSKARPDARTAEGSEGGPKVVVKKVPAKGGRAAPRRAAAPRTRKRAREQGGESGPEAKVAALEIDADTEVQVAQTLACWSLVGKERHQDGSPLSDSLAGDEQQEL
ncbi:pre-mRNA-splicing regulator WTAP-like [Ornithodoros turicata]|uniref:pre-mRNA-splicing regulator WTAP-like n=1 Tax=Ornithodoros turicata TaxID=34597 RepID=UPI003139B0B7